jgi:hypothetical protein
VICSLRSLPATSKAFKMTRFHRFSVAAVASALAGSSMAAIPADVSTAIGAVQADAVAVAVVILVAIVGVYAIKFIRKGL